jgi:addiction module RelE/StbE family toxin
MTYQVILSPDFEKETKVLFKKDPVLYNRFKKTVNSILTNPECGKPLRNVLKGLRRVHIGHFILIYEIDTTTETINFLKVQSSRQSI